MSHKDKSIKTIRVTEKTYAKLASFGKYADSMEKIISSVLEKAEVKNNT